MNTIIQGDCREELKGLTNESVDCVVTSPPYWSLRNYGHTQQIGQESTYQEYLSNLLEVFDEIHRVLKKDGSVFVVIGDVYSQSGNKKNCIDPKRKKEYVITTGRSVSDVPSKCLLQLPDRFAIMMVERGWILRNKIIWHKPNVIPESVKDRFTVDYETVLFFTKSPRYYFKQQKEPFQAKEEVSIRAYLKGDKIRDSKGNARPQGGSRKQDETGNPTYTGFNARYIPANDGMRNKRCVWSVITAGGDGIEHYAMFPKELISPMIDAGCTEGGIVLDPFSGAGTTGLVCKEQKKDYIGIELNEKYVDISKKRIKRHVVQEVMF